MHESPPLHFIVCFCVTYCIIREAGLIFQCTDHRGAFSEVQILGGGHERENNAPWATDFVVWAVAVLGEGRGRPWPQAPRFW